MADDLDQLEEGIGRRVIDSLGRIWRPELHPRDQFGRFVPVLKPILSMRMNSFRPLNDVVDEAPNINSAYVFRTPRGHEIRVDSRAGKYGFNITPVQLAANDGEKLGDALAAADIVTPFPDAPKCPHCGAPSPKGGYLPGHRRAELLKSIRQGLSGITETIQDELDIARSNLERDRNLPTLRDQYRMARGQSPKGARIRRTPSNLISNTINRAVSTRRNQYIYYDRNTEQFLSTDDLLFGGKPGNLDGNLVLRGVVDSLGNYKTLKHRWAMSEPDPVGSRSGLRVAIDTLFADMPGARPRDRETRRVLPRSTSRELASPYERDMPEGANPVAYDLRAQAQRSREEVSDLQTEVEELRSSDQLSDRLRADRLNEEMAAKAAQARALDQQAQDIDNGVSNVVDPFAPDASYHRQQVDLIDAEIIQRQNEPQTPESAQVLRELEVERTSAQLKSGDGIDFDYTADDAVDDLITIGNATPETRRRLVDGLTDEQRRTMAMANSPVGGVLSDPRKLAENAQAVDEAKRALDEKEEIRMAELRASELQRRQNMLDVDDFFDFAFGSNDDDFELVDNLKESRENTVKRIDKLNKDIRASEIELLKLEARNTDQFNYKDRRDHNNKIKSTRRILESMRGRLGQEETHLQNQDRALARAEEGDTSLVYDLQDIYMAFSTEMLPEDQINAFGDLFADNQASARRLIKRYKEEVKQRLNDAEIPDEQIDAEMRRIDGLIDLDNDSKFEVSELVDDIRANSPSRGLLRDADDLYARDEIRLAVQPAAADINQALEYSRLGTTLPPKTTGGKNARKRVRGTLKPIRRNARDPETQFDSSNLFDVTIVENQLHYAPGQGSSNGVYVSSDGYWAVVDLGERGDPSTLLPGGENVILFRKSGRNRWTPENLAMEVDGEDGRTNAQRISQKLAELDLEESNEKELFGARKRNSSSDEEINNYDEFVASVDNDIANYEAARALLKNTGASTEEVKKAEDKLDELRSEKLAGEKQHKVVEQLTREYGSLRLRAREEARFRTVEDAMEAARAENKRLRSQRREGPPSLKDLLDDRKSPTVPFEEAFPQIERLDREIGEYELRRFDTEVPGGVETAEGPIVPTDRGLVASIENEQARRMGYIYDLIKKMDEGDVQRTLEALKDRRIRTRSSEEANRLDRIISNIENATGLLTKTNDERIDLIEKKQLLGRLERRLKDLNSDSANNEGRTITETIPYGSNNEKTWEAEFKIGQGGKGSTVNGHDVVQLAAEIRGINRKIGEVDERIEVIKREDQTPDILEMNERSTVRDRLDSIDVSPWIDNDTGYIIGVDERERSSNPDEVFASAKADYLADPDLFPRDRFIYADDDGFFYSTTPPAAYNEFTKQTGANPPRVFAAVVADDSTVLYEERNPSVRTFVAYNGKKLRVRDSERQQALKYPLADPEDDLEKFYFSLGFSDEDIQKAEIDKIRIRRALRQSGSEREIMVLRQDDSRDSGDRQKADPNGLAGRPVMRTSTRVNAFGQQSNESQIADLQNRASLLRAVIRELEDENISDDDLFPDRPASQRKRLREQTLEQKKRELRDTEEFLKVKTADDPDGLVADELAATAVRDQIDKILVDYEQSANGRTAQVYMDDDGNIEHVYKRSPDPNRRRIATITRVRGINWKDDEVRDSYDRSEDTFAYKLDRMFAGYEDKKAGEYILTSRVIERPYVGALYDDPVNRRSLSPATYKIKKQDEEFVLFNDGDGHDSPKMLGRFDSLANAMNAAWRYENEASADNSTRLPDNDDNKEWSVSGGVLTAKPTNLPGQYRVKRVIYEEDGNLVAKYQVAKFGEGSQDYEGFDKKEYDTLDDAIGDVDSRINTGQRPAEFIDLIDWELIDGRTYKGSAIVNGERADYTIEVTDNGAFRYNNRLFRSLEDARHAVDQDERSREERMALEREGISRSVFDSPLGKPDLRTPPPDPMDARGQQKRQAKSVWGSTSSGERPADAAARAKEEGPKEYKQKSAIVYSDQFEEDLRGIQDIEELGEYLTERGLYYDYETTGRPLGGQFSSQQPLQLGAARIVDGEVQSESWLIRVDRDREPEFYDLFPIQAFDEGRYTVGDMTDEEIEDLRKHLRLYGMGFWNSFGRGMVTDEIKKIDDKDEQVDKLLERVDLSDLVYTTRDFENADTPEVANQKMVDWGASAGKPFILAGYNSSSFDSQIFDRHRPDLPETLLGQFDVSHLFTRSLYDNADWKTTTGKNWPGRQWNLALVADAFGVELVAAHNARDDAIATAKLVTPLVRAVDAVSNRGTSNRREALRSVVGTVDGRRGDGRRGDDLGDLGDDFGTARILADLVDEENAVQAEIRRLIDTGEADNFPFYLDDSQIPKASNADLPSDRRISLRFDGETREVGDVKYSDEQRYSDPESQLPSIRSVAMAEDGFGGLYQIDWEQHEILYDDYDDFGNKIPDSRAVRRGHYTIRHITGEGEVDFTDTLSTEDSRVPTIDDLVSKPPTNKDDNSVFDIINNHRSQLSKSEASSNLPSSVLEKFDGDLPPGFDPENPRHHMLIRLSMGDTDPNTGKKIRSINWTDRGPEVEYYSLTREEIDEAEKIRSARTGKKASAEFREIGEIDQAKLRELNDRYQKHLEVDPEDQDEAWVDELENITRQMAELVDAPEEIPVDMRERRGDDDMTQARRLMGSDEVVDYTGQEQIDDMLERTDEDGFASLESEDVIRLVPFSPSSNDFRKSASAINSYNTIDNAMNGSLTPIRSTIRAGEINDRILNVARNGGEFELGQFVDFDNFPNVRSATIRRENGVLSLTLTRSDGSKVTEFAGPLLSDDGYFPWLHRSLAYHGGGEVPRTIDPRFSRTLRDDLNSLNPNFTTDRPASRWTAHTGQLVHSELMSRLGLKSLNGYDGYVSVRSEHPQIKAYTRIDENGVPHIDIHEDTILDNTAVEKIVHENLHTMSPAINNPGEIISEGLLGWEEGAVHAYSKLIAPSVARKLGLPAPDGNPWRAENDTSAYGDWARAFESVRMATGLSPDEFYRPMLRLHPRDRKKYLQSFADKMKGEGLRGREFTPGSITGEHLFDVVRVLDNPEPNTTSRTPSRAARRLMDLMEREEFAEKVKAKNRRTRLVKQAERYHAEANARAAREQRIADAPSPPPPLPATRGDRGGFASVEFEGPLPEHRKFGNNGDVFKHIILGELVDELQPKTFIEAIPWAERYDLDGYKHSDDDVLDFLDNSVDGPLSSSSYRGVLDSMPGEYPGSSTVARKLAPETTVISPRGANTDGRDWAYSQAEADDFVLIDPMLPKESGPASGMNSYQVFEETARRGSTTMLWTAVLDDDTAGAEFRKRVEAATDNVWIGEVEFDNPAGGMTGIHVAIANATPGSLRRVERRLEEYGGKMKNGKIRTRAGEPLGDRPSVDRLPGVPDDALNPTQRQIIADIDAHDAEIRSSGLTKFGDQRLNIVARATGRDGQPEVISDGDLDRYIEEGEIEVFRGVSAERFVDMYETGPYEAGLGPSVNGYYTSSEKRVAGVYSGFSPRSGSGARTSQDAADGAIQRMTIKKDAKILNLYGYDAARVNESDPELLSLITRLQAEYEDIQEQVSEALDGWRKLNPAPDWEAGRKAHVKWMNDFYTERERLVKSMMDNRWAARHLDSPHMFAMLNGYDVIQYPAMDSGINSMINVVINRAATRISRTRYILGPDGELVPKKGN